jgi:crotonobetaine/carnitine-CoA ligase
VVLRDGGSGDDEVLHEIIKGCQAQLARFKVPRYFSFRNELPKTASLKVAKQSLLASARAGGERTYDRVSGCWIDAGMETTP